MDIRWLGYSSFRLSTRGVSLVTDPYSEDSVGKPFPKVDASIVTFSHDYSFEKQNDLVGGDSVSIFGPGEYEVKGVSITGIRTCNDKGEKENKGLNTLYAFVFDDIFFVHCGFLNHKLEDQHVEILSGVDVLFIPTGGGFVLDPHRAVQVVGQIKPKIVIPMIYRTKDLKTEIQDQLEPIDSFIKEMDIDVLKEKKFSVSRKTLPEEPKLVILEL